jgi:hypothetical protein
VDRDWRLRAITEQQRQECAKGVLIGLEEKRKQVGEGVFPSGSNTIEVRTVASFVCSDKEVHRSLPLAEY